MRKAAIPYLRRFGGSVAGMSRISRLGGRGPGGYDRGMNDTMDKTDLAEERTDWAEDRTILATERTFAGWMRTGLGSVAVALGLQAVFRAIEPTWIAKGVASLFILTGIMIFVIALRNATTTLKRMHPHEADPLSRRKYVLVTSALCVASAAAGGVLWLL